MLKEFAQWLAGNAAPNMVTVGGVEFSDKKLYPVEAMEYHPERDIPDLSVMKSTTLQSIVDFINKDVDEETDYPLDRKIIHIQSPDRVLLTSEVTATGNRWDRLIAQAEVAKYPFSQFLDREVFHIQMQTQFVQNENSEALLQMIGSIADGAVTEANDDNMTQQVTVRQGIQRKGRADVPNPVLLTPYRTFPEAVQPTTPFVFRLRPGRCEGDMPSCALFESDGSMWRVQAMENIATWLIDHLPKDKLDNDEIVIIRQIGGGAGRGVCAAAYFGEHLCQTLIITHPQ